MKKPPASPESMEQQNKRLAGLDALPLGQILDLKNDKLASLSTYATHPAPSDFASYLNRIKRQPGIKNWPRVAEDDDETELAAKFQKLFNRCVEINPGANGRLTVGNTNYFAAVWQNLKEI